MESAKSDNTPTLRKARLPGIVFLAYSMVMPFIIFLIPASELPVSTGPSEVFSWMLMLLMPIIILLIYISYRYFRKKPELDNIYGPANLMYMFAMIPSIYAFIIGFIGSNLRFIAIPFGLGVSIVGFWLAWMFVSSLWETITFSNQ